MTLPFTRRALLVSSAMIALARRADAATPSPPERAFAALEAKAGGRLGVCVLNTGDGRMLNYRAGERFLICSTFKASLAALVLQRIDQGKDTLERRIVITPSDLMSYAPVAKLHVGGAGMTIRDLCEAAVTLSDNTAANLLLATVGGPSGLTAFWRSLGDSVTRLDRTEPALNLTADDPEFDTTTPVSMVRTMHRILLDQTLSAASTKRLIGWLRGNKTGDARLRAGLAGWIVGDKTGTGGQGQTNDIAIAWPPDQAPVLIAVYYQGPTPDDKANSAVIAEVGRIIAETF